MWIIPARAGFTLFPGDRIAQIADHPRSRGVYRSEDGAHRRIAGSSPLARGLLGNDPDLSNVNGIIPARAGFTVVDGGRLKVLGDHPRSRGVYAALLDEDGEPWGSSPLARGLHRLLQAGETLVGIIPARAGFTLSTRSRLRRRRDHPRSRGVYMILENYGTGEYGSSPLARGLQVPDDHR